MRLFVLLFLVLGSPNFGCSEKPKSSGEGSSEAPEVMGEFSVIDAVTFDRLAQGMDGAIVIDLRTPEETAEGKIPGAIEIDYYSDNFESQLDALNKSVTYLIYCRSGKRSGDAAEMMKEKGFLRVYDLGGGYEEWSELHGLNNTGKN